MRMRRATLVLGSIIMAVGGLTAANSGGQAAALAAASPPVPNATTFDGTPAVGALFVVSNTRARHFCTAAVVKSPREDLVITAAHCLEGQRIGMHGDVVFAPGFHNGRFPHGEWIVRSAVVDRSWRRHRDPNDDVAFLVVGRPGRRIQRHTGAETLRIGASLPRHVQVIGYPDASSVPIRCGGRAAALARRGYQQLVFDCGGFTGGTSGGPFLIKVNRTTGDGEVIGVIGGYQRGGDLPSVSYAAQFLKNIAALYQQAVS